MSFEFGVRAKRHKHVGGDQVLLVTAMLVKGQYQQEGEEPRKLHVGDVAVICNGVKHWHGSTADAWLSHIAVLSEAFHSVVGARQWVVVPRGDIQSTVMHPHGSLPHSAIPAPVSLVRSGRE